MEHGEDHSEDIGESTHKDRKADSAASNQKDEHMQMAVRTEERERFGQMLGGGVIAIGCATRR